MENKGNLVEDKSILTSISESSAENISHASYITTYTLEDIWDGNSMHPNINTRYSGLKILDRIKQAQSECK